MRAMADDHYKNVKKYKKPIDFFILIVYNTHEIVFWKAFSGKQQRFKDQ